MLHGPVEGAFRLSNRQMVRNNIINTFDQEMKRHLRESGDIAHQELLKYCKNKIQLRALLDWEKGRG